MINFLFKLIKDRENTKDPKVRKAYGSLCSIVGIIVNILLSLIKLIAGTLSGAIAITADAVNNISDAGSQIISLISFKLSAKPADRDHPFGHARIEYVASMIVSFLVMHVAIDLFTESVNKIFNPSKSEYSWLVIAILAVSIISKLWLCLLNRRAAKKISSDVIRATAADSLSDALATTAVLVSALISKYFDFETDAYMGIIVSVFIFIAGIKILNDTKNSILGSAPDPETVEAIKEITFSHPEFLGIHDMIVHNYGPGNTIASFHVEVDGKENVFIIHDAVDLVEKELYEKLGVTTTIHMDPIVTDDERVNELRAAVTEAVKNIDDALSIHDFRFVEGVTHSNLIFDILAPFECKLSKEELIDLTRTEVKKLDPAYEIVVTVDRQ